MMERSYAICMKGALDFDFKWQRIKAEVRVTLSLLMGEEAFKNKTQLLAPRWPEYSLEVSLAHQRITI